MDLRLRLQNSKLGRRSRWSRYLMKQEIIIDPTALAPAIPPSKIMLLAVYREAGQLSHMRP